ncbi:hypothetical protein GGD56_006844 [Rhizobium mongolense]|uniref:Short-chain fatty acyl coenzyme A regulators C-terminal domain-containing protein n=1 Tax=Rhizobium mongolense TaxID=57676 RepID=A0ABR6IYE9_9HYPH|nr:hypothetical protein [Rhizobium mongolense]
MALVCEATHAERLVYYRQAQSTSPTPIGITCRLCQRDSCRSRSEPPIGRQILLDYYRRTDAPFGFSRLGAPGFTVSSSDYCAFAFSLAATRPFLSFRSTPRPATHASQESGCRARPLPPSADHGKGSVSTQALGWLMQHLAQAHYLKRADTQRNVLPIPTLSSRLSKSPSASMHVMPRP